MKAEAPLIGDLRHKVEWKNPSTERDEYGQVNPDEEYTNLAYRTVSIVPNQATTEVKGQKPEGIVAYTVTGRYLADLKFASRMYWDNRTFKVVGFYDLDGLKQWQVITVVEVRG